MRRLALMVVAAVVVGLTPVVAGAGGGGAHPTRATATAPVPTEHPAGSTASPGPARLDGAVVEAARSAPAGATLDVILSLDHPRPALSGLLDRIGLWSWAFEHVPVAAVRLPVSRLADLRSLEGVKGVYLNQRMQYFLKESAKLVNTEHAWKDLGITGKGVTVAVLDTGVDFTHPDLAPAMKANVKLAEFGDPAPVVPIPGLPDSDTSSGHGTHVAGDVAGRGIASNGDFKGMGYGADLVGIGAGEALSMFAAVEGFDYVMKNREQLGIRVLTNSWGTNFKPFDPTDPIVIASKTLADAGVVVLFANGNDGDEMSMNPYAQPPWVIPVAAGSKDGKVADFSSGGIEADTVGLDFSKVDLAGETRSPLHMGLYHPAVTTTGEKVISTRANGTIIPPTAAAEDAKGIPPNQIPYYTTLSGTSMATPETAGVVALLLQAAPDLTALQVRQVLQITARTLPGIPFFKQGYGYTDASAAVELARSLHGKPAAQITTEVERLQTARDQVILAGLAHPSHTYAWTERGPFLAGSLDHKVSIPAGSGRLKVVTNGGALPLLGVSSYEITVTDAAGKPVGTSSNTGSSGTTILDRDLHKLVPDGTQAAKRFAELAYGEWTVSIAATGSLVPPVDYFLIDDAAAKRSITTLVSVFPPQAPACKTIEAFVPTGSRTYRFQDDKATGPDFPLKPGYKYVGPVPSGRLGQRAPARKLAGTFGQVTTSARPPVFKTGPLGEPVTVGGPAEILTWVQGPSEVVSGLLDGELLDLPPKGAGEPVVIGKTPADAAVMAGSTAPLETKAPLSLTAPHTIPAGHQLAVKLAMSFVGTSGHTLYYDSDQYPSGLTITTGQQLNAPDCPTAADALHTPPQPQPPKASAKSAVSDALRVAPSVIPPAVPALPAPSAGVPAGLPPVTLSKVGLSLP